MRLKRTQSSVSYTHLDVYKRQDLETFSQEAGERDGDFLEQIKTENRSRYDYREFLRKFAVFHEELAVDDDSFDYNFYTYGLRLYGNMPLIEPLESKEVKKIEMCIRDRSCPDCRPPCTESFAPQQQRQ